MATEGTQDVEMAEAESPPKPKSPKLTTGFPKHSEKEKMIHTFHTLVLPSLQKIGWQQKENDEGETLFIPVGVYPADEDSCYFRIKDVIDRLNERRDNSESTIADAYRREMSRPVKPIDIAETQARRTRLDTTDVDAWKKAGSHFPKRCSSVGKDYQVSSLPEAGTFSGYDDDTRTALVWDLKAAEKSGVDITELLKDVDTSIRAEAYMCLMEQNFDVAKFKEAMKQRQPTNGSDWDLEKRRVFAEEIFRFRKDMVAVSKAMGVPLKTCLAYYFGTYKASDDYRLLKTVCCEERMERMDALEHGVDACTICGDGGSLLICDGCEREYHKECLRPKLAQIPEGEWECDECVSTKFLMARDYIVRRTKLFTKVSRKRSLEEAESPSVKANDQSYRPVDEVLKAACDFARRVSTAISQPYESGAGTSTAAEVKS